VNPVGANTWIWQSPLTDETLGLQNEAQAGRLLHVNSQTADSDIHVPFGGIKGSGFGPHEQGRAAMEFYTDTVTIYVDA
jgi:alpha-ketoglutaric semialdehyde dehydrogenase